MRCKWFKYYWNSNQSEMEKNAFSYVLGCEHINWFVPIIYKWKQNFLDKQNCTR